jgi:N-acetylneuraminate synthase
MKTISIGGKKIGARRPVFIIAEVGVNHNGRLDLALQLIDAAAAAGADAVKFQTFKANEVATAEADMAEYQKQNLNKTESQREMLERLELKEWNYATLIGHCKKCKIIFLSTPHGGIPSINFLEKIRHPAYKIASPDLTNRPLIERAAKTKKPILLSTGMGTLQEVKNAVGWLNDAKSGPVILLHCTSDYPTKVDEVNLRAMQTLAATFKLPVGYSDHTSGIQASLMAATLGAVIIEKHFTLDRNMEGPDHAASLEPGELGELISAIRNVEVLLGSPQKKPTASERRIQPLIRKSIVTARAVKKGEKITLDLLRFKRPGTGISPANYKSVVGKRAKKDLPLDHMLNKTDYGA